MSDYETTQKKRSLLVGAFVILGLVAFGWLVFRFGDLPSAVSRFNSFVVYARFPAAPGVRKDTPVRFCGFQVGRVIHVMAPEVLDELQGGVPTGRRYHQTVVLMGLDKRY